MVDWAEIKVETEGVEARTSTTEGVEAKNSTIEGVEARTSTKDKGKEKSDDDSDYQSDKSVDYVSPGEEELIELRNKMKALRKAKAKAKDKPDGITKDPFISVEKHMERYPMYDETTQWRLRKPKERSGEVRVVGKYGQRPPRVFDPEKGKTKKADQDALTEYEKSIDEHYSLLRSYGKATINSNPGSIVKKIIALDGWFPKSPNQGEILTTIGRDGNNHIYLVAWAVVNVKNKDNWTWFLELLKEDLGCSGGNGLTLIGAGGSGGASGSIGRGTGGVGSRGGASSPGKKSERHSNIGGANDQKPLECRSPHNGQLKESNLDSQKKAMSPSASFAKRQRRWKEELAEELERKQELMRKAGVVKTSSPKDQVIRTRSKRPEFSLIIGMRFGTISFCSYTSTDLKFHNKVFSHKVGLVVTNLDVLGVIEDEVMFGNLCDEDSVCLCLILALEVIFMGRLLTCPVDDSLFGLIENLEAWNVFPWGGIRDSRLKTRRLTDRVIKELSVRVFKLETIIQVLALERNDKLGEYLIDEELKLCLEEERIHSEQEKRIQQEKWLRLEEDKMLQLKGEKMLQIADVKKRKHYEFMNSTHVKNILGKFPPIKRNNAHSVTCRAKLKESWVKIKNTAKTYDVSRLFHSMDTIWLSDDIERFISQPGQLKSMFPWSDDYIVSRNFWLRLVCLDPCRKGWLSEEVFIPINESDQHWCLGHLDILSGLVTFYDSGDTYDYEWSDCLAESYNLLEELQDFELKKCRDLMKSIGTFSRYLRRTNEKPENYVIFEVNYDGVFNLHPLRYDHGKILTLKLSKLIRSSFLKLLDMLSYKLECANLLVVLKKKNGRSMVKGTRKRKHQYYKKINKFRKVHGKRVSVKAGKRRLGGLVALNDHEKDIRAKERYWRSWRKLYTLVKERGLGVFWGYVSWVDCLLSRLSLDEGGLHALMYFGLMGGNTSRKGKEIRYELPECTPTKDDTLSCSSSTPISSKLKRNSSKKIKEGLRKKEKATGRTLIDLCDKGKEKVDEFPAVAPTKEHQVVVTNYKRAIVNRKAKMVEVVAPIQENVDVGIKHEDRKRKNILGSMAPANFVKILWCRHQWVRDQVLRLVN
nr:phospholipase-like protein [Tanacetum cinerariifolium]